MQKLLDEIFGNEFVGGVNLRKKLKVIEVSGIIYNPIRNQ